MPSKSHLQRREFLKLTAAGLAATVLSRPASAALLDEQDQRHPELIVEEYFRTIFDGFLRNAQTTSRNWATCDFPGGTKIKTCCTPGGETYTSVARMMPAMVELLQRPPITVPDVAPRISMILPAIFRHAFDPNDEDYWGEPPADKATQRTVESALVAITLHRMGDQLIGSISERVRANINQWLSSCVKVPERKTNHAWFTAINQAVRLELSRKFKEFSGDEQWMIDDLKALDALYVANNDGWYSDAPDLPIYDYYNFWVFANFPLYWGRIIGERYPDWNQKFRERAALFLRKTPYFFAADGSHPLFGRSLIYRWALLSPMVLGYQCRLWPHSPGLLRRIVMRNLKWHWKLGAYDEQAGKLRETLTPDGSPDIKEAYIDNGHPYWAMQAFAMLSLPPDDPLWTAPEEPLPVEKDDFVVKFDAPKMMLVGTKSSGQVKWIQARGCHKRDVYRDKYTKFSYSSHFPFNVTLEKDRATWDQALILRNPATKACAGRAGVIDGELLDDGAETRWWIALEGQRFEISSLIRIAGEFEYRRHVITPQPQWQGKLEVLEGSPALGLNENEQPMTDRAPDGSWQSLASRKTGQRVLIRSLGPPREITATQSFGGEKGDHTNVIWRRCAVNTLTSQMTDQPVTIASLHYASPKPLQLKEILHQFDKLAARFERG